MSMPQFILMLMLALDWLLGSGQLVAISFELFGLRPKSPAWYAWRRGVENSMSQTCVNHVSRAVRNGPVKGQLTMLMWKPVRHFKVRFVV